MHRTASTSCNWGNELKLKLINHWFMVFVGFLCLFCFAHAYCVAVDGMDMIEIIFLSVSLVPIKSNFFLLQLFNLVYYVFIITSRCTEVEPRRRIRRQNVRYAQFPSLILNFVDFCFFFLFFNVTNQNIPT